MNIGFTHLKASTSTRICLAFKSDKPILNQKKRRCVEGIRYHIYTNRYTIKFSTSFLEAYSAYAYLLFYYPQIE
jgi:hypothetical protein